MRLASTSLKVHQACIGNDLLSTTITDAWVDVGEMFGELWIQDIVMNESNLLEDKKDEMPQHMST